MTRTITPKMKIYDIVTNHPETTDTFLAHGFSLITNSVKLETVARFVTLESACAMKQINTDLFIRELNRAVEAEQASQDCCQFQIDEGMGDINIAALLPCPIAIPIKDALKVFAKEFEQRSGLKIGLHIKAAALDINSQLDIPYADYDLFIAPGYDHFKGNHNDHRQIDLPTMNRPFTQAAMPDPNNRYLITGAAPAVIIRNRKKVPDTDLCWNDLCSDRFTGRIATPLAELELQKGVIYQMFCDFGEEGLRQFARNQCGEYHPAEMIKLINRGKLDHIDLFVAPLFFTTMLKNPDFEVVWPADGAIAVPLILYIRNNSTAGLSEIINYLFSAEMAILLSAEGLYPTSHSSTPEPIPENVNLLWPGWQRLYQSDFQQQYQKSLQSYQQYCETQKTRKTKIIDNDAQGDMAMPNLLEKKDQFKTIDLRGESMEFLPRLLEMLDQMKAGQGLHLIKEFEPVPLYPLLKERGFIHQTEAVSADEYHVYLYHPEEKNSGKAGTMAEHIQVDEKRAEILADIVVDFFNGAGLADLKQRSEVIFPVNAPEFAYVEQLISERGISDTQFENQIEDLIQLFKKSLDSGDDLDHFPAGHPIHTYLLENQALKKLIAALRLLLKNTDNQKSTPNYWGDYLENLNQANNHYVRKENQLFPYLEQKGFDKPSTIMWTLHDNTRQFIKQARSACCDPNLDFSTCVEKISTAIDSVADMIYKEEKILFPTAAAMLSEQEWIQARQGEIELDYCLIDEPPMWPEVAEAASQQADQLNDRVSFKLSEGSMSLEQINTIFSHLPVDISFVDADNRVRFYNQCKERIFPRSPAVIGREVKYCHPPKSVDTVLEIIEAFRSGEQDVAEFWLTLGGKFIYIRYFAVRDASNNYQGVLEVMQEVSRIRELEGQQTLLNWGK